MKPLILAVCEEVSHHVSALIDVETPDGLWMSVNRLVWAPSERQVEGQVWSRVTAQAFADTRKVLK